MLQTYSLAAESFLCLLSNYKAFCQLSAPLDAGKREFDELHKESSGVWSNSRVPLPQTMRGKRLSAARGRSSKGNGKRARRRRENKTNQFLSQSIEAITAIIGYKDALT